MHQTDPATKEKERDVPEGGERHKAQKRMCQEEEERKNHPQRSVKRKDVDIRSETHQKSHHAKCAAYDKPDPNSDNPCAHHCNKEKHTQPTG